MKEYVFDSLQTAKAALENLLANEKTVEVIVKAGTILADVFQEGSPNA